MSLTIVQAGDPILRRPARTLEPGEIVSKPIQQLVRQMQKAMRDAPGVGLAAPQVGFSLQLAVIEDRVEYHNDVAASVLSDRERRPVLFHAIVNPVITSMGGGTAEFFEGCLSLPGFTALVPRARAVRVECLDEQGKHRVIEASGWYARILQHEIDHLQGELYIDRMCSRTFTNMENWGRLWKGRSIQEIRAALDV
jgi:peptide deformylase